VSADAGRTWRPAYAWSAESATVWAIVDGQTWLDFTTAAGPMYMEATSDAGDKWTTSTGAGPADRHIMAVLVRERDRRLGHLPGRLHVPGGGVLRDAAPRRPGWPRLMTAA